MGAQGPHINIHQYRRGYSVLASNIKLDVIPEKSNELDKGEYHEYCVLCKVFLKCQKGGFDIYRRKSQHSISNTDYSQVTTYHEYMFPSLYISE